MTVINWVATDTANWTFFSVGILSTALTIVGHLSPSSSVLLVTPRGRFSRFIDFATWSPLVVGPLLLLGGAVLVGTGSGRLGWLSTLSGAVCLLVFAYLVLLEQIHSVVELNRRLLERQAADSVSTQAAPALVEHARQLVRETEWLFRRIEEHRGQSPSAPEIADATYRIFSEHGALPSRVHQDFDDFASSMVHGGVWTPVSVYTSADDGTALKLALTAVLQEFGLAAAVEEPPVRGSWFQRFWARSRDIAESEPVRERLRKLERALELERLGKVQAEIDKAKAEAVAALYGVVKEQQNAVVRMGSIIMIKTADDLVVWTIGEMEAAALEKNSELLRDPVAALKFLHSGRNPHDPHKLDPGDGDD